MKAARSVAVIGPCPPPFGGVTVHVRRLHDYLAEQRFPHTLYVSNGSAVEGAVVGRRSLWWFLGRFLRCREAVVHVQTSRPDLLSLGVLLLRLRNRKVVGSLHGVWIPRSYERANALARWFYRAGMRRLALLLAANEGLKRFAMQVLQVPEQSVAVVPAFLPPSEESVRRAVLPQTVRDFLDSHRPVLCASGVFGRFEPGPPGRDTYGFHLLVPLLSDLRRSRPGVGLLLVQTFCQDERHKSDFLARIEAAGLADHVLLVEDPLDEFAAVLQRCDVFLRPTYVDGDALSVREAVWLGVATVASDCVGRPPECVLFETGSAEDLRVKTESVLADISTGRTPPARSAGYHAGPKIMEHYRQLLGGDE